MLPHRFLPYLGVHAHRYGTTTISIDDVQLRQAPEAFLGFPVSLPWVLVPRDKVSWEGVSDLATLHQPGHPLPSGTGGHDKALGP